MQLGLIQVYTGGGKGKTTAATGLIIRALGQGLRVLLVRFLKPTQPASGELAILQTLPNLDIITAGLGGIDARLRPDELAQNVAACFAAARPKILGGEYDLVVLDEFNGVLAKGYLPLNEGLQLLDARPTGTELVLTGRNAPAEVLARADLITELQELRHPYRKGVPARPGIDY